MLVVVWIGAPEMSHHSEENLLTASGGSFWEPGNYKRTTKRIEDGNRLCTDLIQLVTDRAEIEKNYAKNLKAWSKKWNELIEKGPLSCSRFYFSLIFLVARVFDRFTFDGCMEKKQDLNTERRKRHGKVSSSNRTAFRTCIPKSRTICRRMFRPRSKAGKKMPTTRYNKRATPCPDSNSIVQLKCMTLWLASRWWCWKKRRKWTTISRKPRNLGSKSSTK